MRGRLTLEECLKRARGPILRAGTSGLVAPLLPYARTLSCGRPSRSDGPEACMNTPVGAGRPRNDGGRTSPRLMADPPAAARRLGAARWRADAATRDAHAGHVEPPGPGFEQTAYIVPGHPQILGAGHLPAQGLRASERPSVRVQRRSRGRVEPNARRAPLTPHPRADYTPAWSEQGPQVLLCASRPAPNRFGGSLPKWRPDPVPAASDARAARTAPTSSIWSAQPSNGPRPQARATQGGDGPRPQTPLPQRRRRGGTCSI
jgi:hypothetical protein